MAEEELTTTTQMSAPLLASEALGFSPQLLMDDIISASNLAVQDGVLGMEKYLDQWRTERSAKLGSAASKGKGKEGEEWDGSQEMEQGLVAFQTLLEFHTDQAFDFFEAWALRNIFSLKPGLPVVLTHQQGLDLRKDKVDVGREQELLKEAEVLRGKLQDQRHYRRLLQKALIVSKSQRLRAERRLESLSFLNTPTLQTLHDLPHQITSMQHSFSKHIPAELGVELAKLRLTEPGKRLWERNKVGYWNWALQQLLVREQSEGGGEMEEVRERMRDVGQSDVLRQAAVAATEGNA